MFLKPNIFVDAITYPDVADLFFLYKRSRIMYNLCARVMILCLGYIVYAKYKLQISYVWNSCCHGYQCQKYGIMQYRINSAMSHRQIFYVCMHYHINNYRFIKFWRDYKKYGIAEERITHVQISLDVGKRTIAFRYQLRSGVKRLISIYIYV